MRLGERVRTGSRAPELTVEPVQFSPVELPSIYTPEGSFAYLLVVLVATLAAALAFLVAFAGASLPL